MERNQNRQICPFLATGGFYMTLGLSLEAGGWQGSEGLRNTALITMSLGS